MNNTIKSTNGDFEVLPMDEYSGLPAPNAYEFQRKSCWCHTCNPLDYRKPQTMFMRLCPTCGNKRCPKASNHELACTNSNEPGQEGSIY